MFGAAKTNDGTYEYGRHRFKVHKVSIGATARTGPATVYEVEWQRNFRELESLTMEDPEIPGQPLRYFTSTAWESTPKQFTTPESAVAFAQLVLDGEINAAGEALGSDASNWIKESQARRTQQYYDPRPNGDLP